MGAAAASATSADSPGGGCAPWKNLRKTPHDHDSVNDSVANAEVVLQVIEMGLKLLER